MNTTKKNREKKLNLLEPKELDIEKKINDGQKKKTEVPKKSKHISTDVSNDMDNDINDLHTDVNDNINDVATVSRSVRKVNKTANKTTDKSTNKSANNEIVKKKEPIKAKRKKTQVDSKLKENKVSKKKTELDEVEDCIFSFGTAANIDTFLEEKRPPTNITGVTTTASTTASTTVSTAVSTTASVTDSCDLISKRSNSIDNLIIPKTYADVLTKKTDSQNEIIDETKTEKKQPKFDFQRKVIHEYLSDPSLILHLKLSETEILYVQNKVASLNNKNNYRLFSGYATENYQRRIENRPSLEIFSTTNLVSEKQHNQRDAQFTIKEEELNSTECTGEKSQNQNSNLSSNLSSNLLPPVEPVVAAIGEYASFTTNEESDSSRSRIYPAQIDNNESTSSKILRPWDTNINLDYCVQSSIDDICKYHPDSFESEPQPYGNTSATKNQLQLREFVAGIPEEYENEYDVDDATGVEKINIADIHEENKLHRKVQLGELHQLHQLHQLDAEFLHNGTPFVDISSDDENFKLDGISSNLKDDSFHLRNSHGTDELPNHINFVEENNEKFKNNHFENLEYETSDPKKCSYYESLTDANKEYHYHFAREDQLFLSNKQKEMVSTQKNMDPKLKTMKNCICWWCIHPIDNNNYLSRRRHYSLQDSVPIFGAPVRKFPATSVFEVVGTFCSPSCALAFIHESGHRYGDINNQVSWLHEMYAESNYKVHQRKIPNNQKDCDEASDNMDSFSSTPDSELNLTLETINNDNRITCLQNSTEDVLRPREMISNFGNISGSPQGVFPLDDAVFIEKAPPRELLYLFGGSMSIEEFRQSKASLLVVSKKTKTEKNESETLMENKSSEDNNGLLSSCGEEVTGVNRGAISRRFVTSAPFVSLINFSDEVSVLFKKSKTSIPRNNNDPFLQTKHHNTGDKLSMTELDFSGSFKPKQTISRSIAKRNEKPLPGNSSLEILSDAAEFPPLQSMFSYSLENTLQPKNKSVEEEVANKKLANYQKMMKYKKLMKIQQYKKFHAGKYNNETHEKKLYHRAQQTGQKTEGLNLKQQNKKQMNTKSDGLEQFIRLQTQRI